MAKKRPERAETDAPAEAAELMDGVEADHLLAPGPEVAEEYWEGDDEALVIEPDDEPEPPVSADRTDTVAHADTDADDLDDVLAETIDHEIHELATERDTYRDIAQRLQADFENYRKRVSAQVDGEVERATGRLAAALLPVLDAAEAAYVQHPDEVGPLLNLMLAELRKHGLEHIDLLDKPFDPNLAEAVAHEPGDGGEPVVAEVLRSGYLWHGRTLRPAMVRTRD